MRAVAEARGLALTVAGAAPCPVRGDEDQLRRLLFNLLDNAIKYTPSGGTIAVRVTCPYSRAQVEVADTGIGIAPEHLEHLFERFYRVDPARGRESDGTGLGLAICRSIAEAHGGTIAVESAVGRGTRVTLTLPAADDGEAVSRPC
jgi:signal transduction histidine kinase